MFSHGPYLLAITEGWVVTITLNFVTHSRTQVQENLYC